MPAFIDIHCHLDHPTLYSQIDEVVKNAKKAGTKVILTNGIDTKSNRVTLELSKKYDIIKPALGYYPPDAMLDEEGNTGKLSEEDFQRELQFIEKNKDNILAIGEIGMDYHHGKDKEMQERVFIKLLQLAKKINKPVLIHSRKAEADVIDILKQQNMKKVIMHCFSGKKSLVKQASELGYSFSIPTNVVRSESFQQIIQLVPLDQLFAETDAPFLSPFREKHNQPAYVSESYKEIARIKGLTMDEAKNNLWLNYQRMF